MVVSVCVGSSCHMKGSYQVIKTFQELIKKNQLEDFVELKASFCMGRCLTGISVMVDDKPVDNVGFVNAESVFYEHIFPLAEAQKSGQ
ncbi:(2Fe-2S) ferredoxin domain-containing protein [Oscillospiraceae bacterium NSJ-54]|uniref:(2Fe-2S) ferredoxin domain-containing protein n=2 Tax=Zongyangia hominis TaxID=2763677 RepID=A0A926ECV3_9FIRM|nr:(2Fe-2S) ferredoxin domain-containing protein [Zongyangia hominis]